MSECLTLEDETPDGKQVEIDLINQIIKNFEDQWRKNEEILDIFLDKNIITILPTQQEKRKKEEKEQEKFQEKKKEKKEENKYLLSPIAAYYYYYYQYQAIYQYENFYKREILRRTINQLENFKLTVIQRLKQLISKKNGQNKGELYKKSSKAFFQNYFKLKNIFLTKNSETLFANLNMQNKESYEEILDEDKVFKIIKKSDDKNLTVHQEIQMLIFLNMFYAIFELLFFGKLNENEFLKSNICYDFMIEPVFKLDENFLLLNLKNLKEKTKNTFEKNIFFFEILTIKSLNLFETFFKSENRQQLNELVVFLQNEKLDEKELLVQELKKLQQLLQENEIPFRDASFELSDSLKQIIELSEKLMKQLDLKKEITELNPKFMKKILENLNEQYLFMKKSKNDEEGEKFSTASIFFQLMMLFFSFLKIFHIEIKRIKEVSKEQQNITLKKQFKQLSQLNPKPYQKYKF